ncbi:DUF4251 domain-containing protein [Chitinophaga silvatica]|uniref:DUF4251 domain-containing protein n=1 Tax=Chitinophaga silvatica TaxID=2282649 RepID=A0A3E1Y9A1_9BACT|nr:DUF4251 domain-containing protein [Chitinophaga silvatica]RFS21984.1 DUF4251 domain-containing protein [Chitinophaga silvatica]
MKRFIAIKLSLLLVAGLLAAPLLHAQNTKAEKKAEKLAAVKSLIDSQNFVFNAQNAFPVGGRMRNITSNYDLTITKDSVISFLPYFGRAFTADYNVTKSPLDFVSTSFEYSVAPGKKDGWAVTIKPKDNKSVQTMYLTVSSEGYASLQVTSIDRTSISFNGDISSIPDRHSKK